jgi:hypothetical protein
LASHPQRAQHLYRAGAGRGLSSGGAGLHCPGRRFGIHGIRFAAASAGASVGTIHLDYDHVSSP